MILVPALSSCMIEPGRLSTRGRGAQSAAGTRSKGYRRLNDTILQEVADATSLREGVAGVEALLRAVHRNESGRLADAAREARLPLPVATAVRRELEKRGVLMRQHGLAFTPDGEQW